MTRPIKLDKELNDLDRLVLDFVRILNKSHVSYVLVSGYLSILFGRSRSSEDIDLIVEKIPYERFVTIWSEITAVLIVWSLKHPSAHMKTTPRHID